MRNVDHGGERCRWRCITVLRTRFSLPAAVMTVATIAAAMAVATAAIAFAAFARRARVLRPARLGLFCVLDRRCGTIGACGRRTLLARRTFALRLPFA